MKLKAIITQRQSTDTHGTLVDVLEHSYVDFFSKLNIEVFPISNFTPNPLFIVDIVKPDFIILTGGGDLPIDDTKLESIQKHRDDLEKHIVENYIGRIPILAICRGMQYINLLFNGKVQKLKDLKVKRPIRIDHNVTLGKTVSKVNNYHNYGFKINDLAKEFKTIAIDDENEIVEAFYSLSLKVLAVQWHPERPFIDQKSFEKSFELINEFIIKRGEINESYYLSSGTRNKTQKVY